MLGFNLWDLSLTLEVWDLEVGFIKPWVLQLQHPDFVVWFSQGSYQLVSKSSPSCLSAANEWCGWSLALQFFPETSQRATNPCGLQDCKVRWDVRIQFKVWDLSPTLESMRFQYGVYKALDSPTTVVNE